VCDATRTMNATTIGKPGIIFKFMSSVFNIGAAYNLSILSKGSFPDSAMQA